jgi:hypothetical protein
MSKDAVPDEPCDPRVEVMGDLKGKVEHVKLLDLDLTDPVLFPQMNIDVFWEMAPDELGGMQFMPKPEFVNLFNSTIMNLRDLPVFGTTGEVARCTKFLISRVHDRSLWLDKRYPIHAEDIHQLTGLSFEGEDVSKGFQGPGKHDKKKGELSLYEKFNTKRGGRTTVIDPILPETVRTGCYIIANKVMRSYYKGECTLDALSVADFCANDVVFNWCSYLLEELLVACEEAQEKGGTFTYGYLLMEFAMFKWKPPMGRASTLPDKGRMAKMFEPWQSRSDSENAAFNTATFSKWYNGLIDATQRLCIPQELLNCNTRNISFSMNRHHTFVWPRHVSKEDFHSRMLPFYLDEEAFDKEVMSWPGVKHNPHKSGMHYILPESC